MRLTWRSRDWWIWGWWFCYRIRGTRPYREHPQCDGPQSCSRRRRHLLLLSSKVSRVSKGCHVLWICRKRLVEVWERNQQVAQVVQRQCLEESQDHNPGFSIYRSFLQHRTSLFEFAGNWKITKYGGSQKNESHLQRDRIATTFPGPSVRLLWEKEAAWPDGL